MKPPSAPPSQAGFLIAKVHQISGRIFARLLKSDERVEINPAQGRIMYALWRADGQSIRELSKATALEPSTLTSMLDRLEILGLIRRENDSSDRRIVIIRRTERDRALEAAYAKVSVEMTELFFGGMDASEIAAFEGGLEKILANLEAAESDAKA
ncbi:MAG: MarR family transcriptional regulator [Spirochaetaceae bacterium]|nr:MarR family transcriptional regulator [Spirochaetaceae bacterium]